MKFRSLLLIVFLGLLTTASNAFAVAAPERLQKIDIGFDISGAITTDSELSSAAYVGFNAAYGVKDWLAIGVSLGRTQFSQNETIAGSVTIPGPDISAYPLFVDFIFKKEFEDKPYVPYAVLGLGTIFWKTKDVFGANNLQYESSIDTSLALKMGAGVDWFLDDHWALNLNFDYILTNSTAALTNGTISTREDINLDYWNLGGGVKYLF